jgi:uncharacterized cofD-like protein
MSSPRVVAIGGGHGTAVTLRAARCFSDDLVGIVSIADDGGSSGRLREILDVPALGDLRKCLIALSDPSSQLAKAMEHRYLDGELAGHALGNLILAGLIQAAGDLVAGIDEAHRLLGGVGRVLPATDVKVCLETRVGERVAHGQVAVGQEHLIYKVTLSPELPSSPRPAIEAIRDADQVVIGPGSLYTSILAATIAPEILEALQESLAQRVFVCNLHPQRPESDGYSVSDHERALKRHGVPVDVILCDTSRGLVVGEPASRVVDCDLAGGNGKVHDPRKLAAALERLYVEHRHQREQT